MDNDRKSFWSAVIAALITLVGTVVAAVIVNWDDACKFFGSENCPRPTLAPPVISEPTMIPNLAATPTPRPEPVTISIYSSDTKEDWLNAVAQAFDDGGYTTSAGNPITVTIVHVKSGESMKALLEGKIQPIVWSPGEQNWVDQINQLWTDRTHKPLIPEPCRATAHVPVGFAMMRPMAEAMGWPDKPIGWAEIQALATDPEGWARYGHAEWGRFKFGHTHPDYSNSGLLILTTLAYATLDSSEGLTPEMVRGDDFLSAMRTLEVNTFHYGRSSRDNTMRMMELGPGFLHATNATEAETLRTNMDPAAVDSRFKLVFVLPAEGTIWSDHPYCVLDAAWSSDTQREAAGIFGDYLLAPAQQALAVAHYLRPVDPTIPLGSPFTLENGIAPDATAPALPSPSEAMAGAIKDAFHKTMKELTVVLALDTSTSMAGIKITRAREATAGFVNALAGDDEIYLYVFNTSVTLLEPNGRVGDAGEKLRSTVLDLYADGSTALYDAVCTASEKIVAQRAADAEDDDPRLYGIVVLSDGKNEGGTRTENEMFDCLPAGEDVPTIPIFTIAYGSDADQELLTRIANRTNGKFYQGGPDTIQNILLNILTD